MGVAGFDHIALPTADAERFIAFYKRLGFGIEGEAAWRAGRHPIVSVTFGDNKINVHPEAMVAMRGESFYLRGPAAEPGCGDVCFVWEGGIDALLAHLEHAGVAPIEGPVMRRGGRSAGSVPEREAGSVPEPEARSAPERQTGISVYVRDPDENLLEFISYEAGDVQRYS